jgi:hypothetical protein
VADSDLGPRVTGNAQPGDCLADRLVQPGGVMARAAITYTLFKADLTRCVAYRLSIVHWIMTALQLRPQRRWLLTP